MAFSELKNFTILTLLELNMKKILDKFVTINATLLFVFSTLAIFPSIIKSETLNSLEFLNLKLSVKENDKFVTESQFNLALAAYLGGETETMVTYDFLSNTGKVVEGYIRVDVETQNYVIEGGLDKRSSLDSIQQAAFASSITGKTPVVAVFDTDGKWGKFEYRIWEASKRLGVMFIWFDGVQVKRMSGEL